MKCLGKCIKQVNYHLFIYKYLFIYLFIRCVTVQKQTILQNTPGNRSAVSSGHWIMSTSSMPGNGSVTYLWLMC